MKEECGTGLNVSFWASTGFTPDCLPTRYLNWAEFPRPTTKSICSPGLTAMRRVTVTAGPERVLWTIKTTPRRAPTTTSAMPALTFPFIIRDNLVASTQRCQHTPRGKAATEQGRQTETWREKKKKKNPIFFSSFFFFFF